MCFFLSLSIQYRDVLVVTIATEMAAVFPVRVMDVPTIVTRLQGDVW